MKRSTSTFRAVLGFPFGLAAETFARLCLWVSGNQYDVDFNYLADDSCPWEKPFD